MAASTEAVTETVVSRLLAAIERRDLRWIHDALSPDASWQNVPHPPAVGREAVLAMLAPILTWSDHVEWQVVSSAYDQRSAWLERIDRFIIDGAAHAVRCCGVFTVDPELGAVTEVRDYVDLGEWRTRIAPVYDRLRNRSAIEVVQRHLAAVADRDLVSMAADYTLDARLVRGADIHGGWRELRDYFDTVPERLVGRELRFDTTELIDSGTDAGKVRVAWSIWHDTEPVSHGTDTYTVESGRITHQHVLLGAPDF